MTFILTNLYGGLWWVCVLRKMDDGQIKMVLRIVERTAAVMLSLIGVAMMLYLFIQPPETHRQMPSWKARFEYHFVPKVDLSSYSCLASYM